MRQIVPGVHLVEGLRGSNVYLLTGGDVLTLIDAGMAGDVPAILAQLAQAGRSVSEVGRIVLTHAHGDHAGGAPELARRTGVWICAHRDEAAYIERTRALPASSAIQRAMIWLGDHLLFRIGPCPVDRAVDDRDVIDALGGVEVVHTPGHTPGSMSLYQRERQILFCGDAVFNAHPLTGRPGLRLPLRSVSVDNALARQSVARLAALEVEVLCCGHGPPILSDARQGLAELLSSEQT